MPPRLRNRPARRPQPEAGLDRSGLPIRGLTQRLFLQIGRTRDPDLVGERSETAIPRPERCSGVQKTSGKERCVDISDTATEQASGLYENAYLGASRPGNPGSRSRRPNTSTVSEPSAISATTRPWQTIAPAESCPASLASPFPQMVDPDRGVRRESRKGPATGRRLDLRLCSTQPGQPLEHCRARSRPSEPRAGVHRARGDRSASWLRQEADYPRSRSRSYGKSLISMCVR